MFRFVHFAEASVESYEDHYKLFVVRAVVFIILDEQKGDKDGGGCVSVWCRLSANYGIICFQLILR